jgi:hypothetical protein
VIFLAPDAQSCPAASMDALVTFLSRNHHNVIIEGVSGSP